MPRSEQKCPCEQAGCPGLEQLREFTSWEDLTAHCGEVTIVQWVNAWANRKDRDRFSRQKYGAKQRALVKEMRGRLAPDELAAIDRMAAEKASEQQ